MNEYRKYDDYDNGEAPRKEEELREYAPRRDRRPKQPWYNQRWLIAMALLIGVGVLAVALSGLTQEVAGVSSSIQEQTEAIEEQTSALAGMRQAVEDLTDAVAIGFERLVHEIRAAAGQG